MTRISLQHQLALRNKALEEHVNNIAENSETKFPTNWLQYRTWECDYYYIKKIGSESSVSEKHQKNKPLILEELSKGRKLVSQSEAIARRSDRSPRLPLHEKVTKANRELDIAVSQRNELIRQNQELLAKLDVIRKSLEIREKGRKALMERNQELMRQLNSLSQGLTLVSTSEKP